MLEAAGIPVVAAPSNVDERALEAALDSDEPMEIALMLARAKAERVARDHPRHIVLGADQVLWDGRQVIGKPDGPDDHLARLKAMRGKTHELLTAWCVVAPHSDEGGVRVGVTRTHLTMRADLLDAELASYVATGEGSGCAGGYAIEGHGAWLFERVDGDWNNIIGLPLFDVISVLRDLGVRYGGAGE